MTGLSWSSVMAATAAWIFSATVRAPDEAGCRQQDGELVAAEAEHLVRLAARVAQNLATCLSITLPAWWPRRSL